MFSISPSAFGVYDSTWAMLGSWVGLLKREAPWLSIERVSDTSSLNITRLPVNHTFPGDHCNVSPLQHMKNCVSKELFWGPQKMPNLHLIRVHDDVGTHRNGLLQWSTCTSMDAGVVPICSNVMEQQLYKSSNHFKWCLNMDEHGWASLSIHVVSRPAILLWKTMGFPIDLAVLIPAPLGCVAW